MSRKNLSLHDQKKVWKLKNQAKKMPHFPEGKIKGEIVYRNYEALPLKPNQKLFNWRNIEWVSIRGFLKETNSSEVFWAKMKIKGKSSSQRIVLKVFSDVSLICQDHLKVIERLDKTDVPHPKMQPLFFKGGKAHGILMEPFLRKSYGYIEPKFNPSDLIFFKLDLGTKGDLNLFKQAVNSTAKMAKVGLFFKQMRNKPRFGNLLVDVFNVVKSKAGAEKVIVQDIDSVRIIENPLVCWQRSTKVLLDTISSIKPENAEIARKIIEKVRKRYNF